MKNKLFLILTLILLFNNCNNTLAPETMIDVDWLIIKNPEYTHHSYEAVVNEQYPDGTGEYQDVEYDDVLGYLFLFNSSVSNIYPDYDIDSISSTWSVPELTTDNFNGTLTFTYNNEEYSYDISDSYHQETEEYVIMSDLWHAYTSLKCDTEMKNHCEVFWTNGFGTLMSLSSPFILIDYR